MYFHLTHWVTKKINGKELILFHWNTNDSVEIFDEAHPMYSFIDKEEVFIDIPTLSEDHKSDIEWLLDNTFLINKDSLIPVKNIRLEQDKQDTLQLILLPAGEACNLACVYCYEDHSNRKSMNISHQEILLKFIKNSGKKRVAIEYFGGEPTLNMKFIAEFSKLLKQNNIEYSASITTNATLINEREFELLYQSNVKSFQITLDGYRELHNKLRPSKNGSIDSYDRVINALRIIQKSQYQDVHVILRLNLNSESISSENYGLFVQTIEHTIPKEDKRFYILPKIISDYSSYNLFDNKQAQDTYCKSRDAADEVSKKFEAYIDDNYQSATALLLTKFGGFSCYAGNPNSFVVTPDLKVRKCTVALEDPINFVGYLNEHGILQKTINFELWVKDYSDEYCLSCFLYKTCQGNSCPLENIKKSRKVCLPIKTQKDEITNKVINFLKQEDS